PPEQEASQQIHLTCDTSLLHIFDASGQRVKKLPRQIFLWVVIATGTSRETDTCDSPASVYYFWVAATEAFNGVSNGFSIIPHRVKLIGLLA
ncbi:MAG: hypothetical protein ACI9KN_002439, partial [Gammaproteobacteria bacterium]